jgi:hypothetical protein
MIRNAVILPVFLLVFVLCTGCNKKEKKPEETPLAKEVKTEFLRTWKAYKTYAWGHDVLLPLSKGYKDWYEKSLHISLIDAYSTMMVMGLIEEAAGVEQYIMDSVDWDKDLFLKTFEVNIRILGGLLAMYEYSRKPEILESAYYLYNATGEEKYMDMIRQYWKDLLQYCKTELAFASVEDVRSMKKRDYMPTYFLAETLKYFYLAFNHETGTFNPDDYIFNTEAHPFLRAGFEKDQLKMRLGL